MRRWTSRTACALRYGAGTSATETGWPIMPVDSPAAATRPFFVLVIGNPLRPNVLSWALQPSRREARIVCRPGKAAPIVNALDGQRKFHRELRMTDDTITGTPAAASQETRGFQAEVKQLLHLMIHSLYSHPEIFLRELISNASDAADKLRFEALEHPDYYEDDPELSITVAFDKDARTISVRDNGIGMAYDEVIAHIGTIAKSGTREFFAALSGDQAKDARLIGQFGVGFYSSFIVADRVTLVTRRAGLPANEGVRWESAGEGEYTIERIDRRARGTE